MQLDSLGTASESSLMRSLQQLNRVSISTGGKISTGNSAFDPARRENDNLQPGAHKDSTHGSSEPWHLCTPWEQGMISLMPPERVGHSSKTTMNGFCLIPGRHCQHYNARRCGFISHQTFKTSLWGGKKDEKDLPG